MVRSVHHLKEWQNKAWGASAPGTYQARGYKMIPSYEQCQEAHSAIIGYVNPDLDRVASILGVKMENLEDALLDCEIEKCDGCDHWFDSFMLNVGSEGEPLCDDCNKKLG
jgi:hypothetical protein